MMLDFDEILVNVKNPQVKKYLKEAIRSYGVGNYRSAILAVWIATMFDLVNKFEVLVEQREPTAIDKWNNLKPKIEGHKNWEMELIHAAKAVAMISRYEADTLEALSKTRNRYAHPSFDDVGTLFDPTPEEVRYFIRTLYDIVLSQPAQLGAFYVTQLLEAIKSPNFFTPQPFADELGLAKNLVSEKVSRINQKQIPRLIKELFQALNSPISREHELNILGFVINLWGTQAELQLPIKISTYWDDYISNKELSLRTLEAILNYPECLNELSERSQQTIDTLLRNEFLERRSYSESFIKFLAYADVVPLAKSLLDDFPNLIPLEQAIEQSGHYKYLLGNKYAEIFGEAIFEETRRVLRTRNGYKVNPALYALCECGIWNRADTLSSIEQVSFANELIDSLNSNNWATMNLLSFNNRQDIPIKWSKLLLEQWSDKLQTDSRIQKALLTYLEHYLGLVEHYKTELGTYARLEEILKILIVITKENSHALESISELASNEALWTFWRKFLAEHQDVIVSTPLEDMI